MKWPDWQNDNVYTAVIDKCDGTQLPDGIFPDLHSKLVVAEYNA
jgi:hypothetical protein